MNKESAVHAAQDRHVGVIGSGTMGAGIAQVAAEAGFTVHTFDAQPEQVKSAHAAIRERLDRSAAKGRISHAERDAIVARLTVAGSLSELASADLVIEAVPEDLALKRRLLGEIDGLCGPRTVLASNTSSLSIGKLAEGLRRANRFLGMHFFNPAPVMALVELVFGPNTDAQTQVEGVAYANVFKKTPIKVKDSPGFVVNRVARPFYLESLAMLERGLADIQTLDNAVRTAGGFPMGPFQLLDLIGLDVNLAVTRSVHDGFNHPPRFAPNPIQAKLVEQGRLGRKSRRGFYDYSADPATPAYETRVQADAWKPDAAVGAFIEALGLKVDRASQLYARILLAVINEAARAAETIALPRDVDLGMKHGTNWPAGPLELADQAGLDLVLAAMKSLHAGDATGRFEPAALLLAHVRDGHLGEKSAHGFLRHWL
ncbi:MAG: 3-hydroxyacyl-CoA dehydrogenase NAD-binding domain-containing protein [Phycisphaerae bacterium]